MISCPPSRPMSPSGFFVAAGTRRPYSPNGMRLLCWNIRHGGGRQSQRIADAIVRHEPDIVVLTEYQPQRGGPLRSTFESNGLRHIDATAPAPRLNGVLIAARSPFVRRPTPENIGPFVDRWLEVQFPKERFALAGVYLPTANPALTRFWELIHVAATQRRTEPFLFVGDFNTGHTPLDAENYTFSCDRYYSGMAMCGFTEAWRHRHGRTLEYTWYSNNRGRRNGFRIDHAFASARMLRRIRGCRYSHREREEGVSDHSMLIVEVR